MITKYTIFYVGQAPEEHEIDWPRDPGYDRIRALVGPILDNQSFEHVSCLALEKADPASGDITSSDFRSMFVDENGIDKDLPFNALATEIYRAYARHRRMTNTSSIYGTAIVFSRNVWF